MKQIKENKLLIIVLITMVFVILNLSIDVLVFQQSYLYDNSISIILALCILGGISLIIYLFGVDLAICILVITFICKLLLLITMRGVKQLTIPTYITTQEYTNSLLIDNLVNHLEKMFWNQVLPLFLVEIFVLYMLSKYLNYSKLNSIIIYCTTATFFQLISPFII